MAQRKIFYKVPCLILTITLVKSNFCGIGDSKQNYLKASEPNHHNSAQLPQPQILQTQISQRDMQIIDRLVKIAQRKSSQVRESRAAMSLSRFVDVVSIEVAPYRLNRQYISSSPSSEDENGLTATITIDPVKLVNAFAQQPIATARWEEAKNQKRVAVIQYYFAYLQARQATRIATHKMAKFTHTPTVASTGRTTSNSPTTNHLDNPDYVTAATEMLAASTRERVALEELAASVGLSTEDAIAILNEN